ncbi:hypothetical protein PRUPE_7G028100 [Prunus persica]|uniref:Uncharacterized protein n=1 Tax=Prunus persica TaxID=3760 RepID=A0A251N5Y4_PRUPE|nr:hypothetical protein PRUPE_7G028100 [Prunus persica]
MQHLMGTKGVIVDPVEEITVAVSDMIKPTTAEDRGDKNLLEGDKKMQMQIAKDPSGKEINALEQHIKNLLNPSTPLFFNTLNDPYREDVDLFRGYPFSFRGGVPTAVSLGLGLNIPDYDALPSLPIL